MTTAAALAHVNRLPVLLLPGDVFASRRPDPVLQQVEDFGDGLVTANDCLRPVSRYFDRLSRPEQLLTAMDRALQVLTDPAECGPVTLGLCQDVQAEAFDWPARFLEEREWAVRRRPAAESDLLEAARALSSAKRPVLACGGGVLYSEAEAELLKFVEQHSIPVVETQAGKSALPASHRLNLGAVGVTGTTAANNLIDQADVILAVGTRLQDFTTGSGKLIREGGQTLIGLNVQRFDAFKFGAQPLLADAQVGLRQLNESLGSWAASKTWTDEALRQTRDWQTVARVFTAPAVKSGDLPSDAQVIGVVNGNSHPTDIVVCAAGGLPGELHKHWHAERPGGYHLEYGYSCMGYEIAGGLGVKLAQPDREVIVMVGDGSYLMMNSEIATSIQLGCRLIIVLLDNRGFGCIERLQGATGNVSFNNLLPESAPRVDFAAHAGSLGAKACHVSSLDELREAIATARKAERTSVIVIETDPRASTSAGGHWWDVAVPEVSQREEVRAARDAYDSQLTTLKPERD
jgi:3D-(3,5/4)-trihydroxycyclohexane-1,2-dione acylhydrolase (decyclizing)